MIAINLEIGLGHDSASQFAEAAVPRDHQHLTWQFDTGDEPLGKRSLSITGSGRPP